MYVLCFTFVRFYVLFRPTCLFIWEKTSDNVCSFSVFCIFLVVHGCPFSGCDLFSFVFLLCFWGKALGRGPVSCIYVCLVLVHIFLR